MRTTGFIDVADCAERDVVILQSPQGPYRPPPPAYTGQDLGPMMRRVPQRRGDDGVAIVPAVRLDLITVRNGWFAVGNGLDGVILTSDRRMVAQAAMFSNPGRAGQSVVEIDLPQTATRFDDVFIGFNASWMNWYHWLCFALPRSALAAQLLPRRSPIVLPDYQARAGSARIRFGEATWRQSQDVFGLRDRVTLLPPGWYGAKAIRLFWTTPSEPTDLTLLHAFHDLFAAARRRLRRSPASPRRVLISREAGANWRVSPQETAQLNRAAERYGFRKLFFERMDCAEQMQAMFDAEAIIGVHGAGLANLLFARRDAKVLEINQPLDAGLLLRPWFYLLAHARHMPYRCLNSAVGDVTEDRIAGVLESLGLG